MRPRQKRLIRGDGDIVDIMSDEQRDPLEEERARARETAPDQPETDHPDVPNHATLGAPARRDQSRPVFRSSQLQEDEERPPEAPPLRG